MDKPLPILEKWKRDIYENLQQEEMEEVSASSNKATVNIRRRLKIGQDPWVECFPDDDSNKSAKKSSTSSHSNKIRIRHKVLEMISNQLSVTDDELNRCKSALIKEGLKHNLPALSSSPNALRMLFLNFRGGFVENLNKQEKLYGDMLLYVQRWKMCIKNGLEALKPLSSITVPANTTVDSAKAIISDVKKAMLGFEKFVFLAEENLAGVFENFDKYQELDEKFNRDVFRLSANFLAKFLVIRCMRKRKNTSL